MPRTFAAFAVCLLAGATVAFGQAQDFKGKVKVDKGQLSKVKKIVLVDILGETKLDAKKVEPWTEDATKALADQLRQAGYEVIAGPEVKAAYQEIAPMPTEEQLTAVIKKKMKMSDENAAKSAKGVAQIWAMSEPGEAGKYGYSHHRPDFSVNLHRPVFSPDDPSHSKNPDKKEIQHRIASLAAKLSVDSIVVADFGFGSWHYEEPAYLKGHTPGILTGIQMVKGTLKGTEAQAFIELTVYDHEGKDEIVLANGSCQSEEGTGLSLRIASKVEDMMSPTTEACLKKVVEKMTKK